MVSDHPKSSSELLLTSRINCGSVWCVTLTHGYQRWKPKLFSFQHENSLKPPLRFPLHLSLFHYLEPGRLWTGAWCKVLRLFPAHLIHQTKRKTVCFYRPEPTIRQNTKWDSFGSFFLASKLVKLQRKSWIGYNQLLKSLSKYWVDKKWFRHQNKPIF